MLIVNLVPSGQGWFPINYMVTLACELLEAKLIDLSDTATTLFTKLAAIVSQRKASDAQEETCLLVCASPTDLLGIYKIEGWRTRFKFLAAWVIDSFWLEWIPMSVRLANPFDCIFITTGEHAEAWHRITGIDPIWLPWGTDVLRLGSGAEVREWDLLRVGRQPMQWDDDAATAALAERASIRFHPRPSAAEKDPLETHRSLMGLYAHSKFLLAFSNTAHRTNYTHPTRPYLTGRWVDALACGAVVAGVAPKSQCIDELLWEGATLELETLEREEGLHRIRLALDAWMPDTAMRNYLMALERLDWRYRFKVIAGVFGAEPKALGVELQLLKRKLAASRRALLSARLRGR